jgi:aminopeptidase N
MKTEDKSFNYLSDFKELEFTTPEAFFDFEIGKEKTKVVATYTVERKSDAGTDLFLNGESIEFISLKVNGDDWSDYTLTDKGLTLHNLPKDKSFQIEVSNYNFPEKNTALNGLYVSGPILCTQCEPMGFRKITFSVDRPDNIVKVKTKIRGDKKDFPFMLSNGNKTDEGDDFVTWEDPFPKPLYLFALVAGDLAELSDTFTTRSGRKVDIKFYCDHGAEHKCDFAIESLKKAMKWDEDRFNLEYDLDLYMVVAVDSFNMGAMENKGLNIFNSALVLADPTTATDTDYHRIESVIGHEYFHNWTGNRVTLKNWFQLTLKEGLTVFRDQEFSGDLNDASVERVDMVHSLKERQFPEDASPLAHPIRPEQYKEMNNFYTSTVYEKGAEVIRMFHTLMGEEKFQASMKEYFKKYDGKSITTEDFVNTMCDGDVRIDKSKMTRWYKTPGTPHVKIIEHYDMNSKSLKIEFHQHNNKALEKKQGFTETYIPVKFEVFHSGNEKVESSEEQAFIDKNIFILSEKTQVLEIEGVEGDYQVSYFQDFSAPVTYEVKSQRRSLTDLALKDTNAFNVYNSIQTSALEYVERKNEDHLEALKSLFDSSRLSLLMKSHLLKPLTFNALIEGQAEFDPKAINKKVSDYKSMVGEALGRDFLSFCEARPLNAYKYTIDEKGHRTLYFKLLDYLLSSDSFRPKAESLLENLFEKSDNMTTSFNCLYLSQTHEIQRAGEISNAFYDQHHKDGLTLQKWISSYVSTPNFSEASKRVVEVEALEAYSEKVPNFVRALWGSFIRNPEVVHYDDGEGYALALDAILKIDAINPQMSSAMMKGLSFASRLKGSSRTAMIKRLEDFSSNNEKFSTHLNETFQSIYGQVNKEA